MTKVTHDTTAERYLITVDGRDAGARQGLDRSA